MQFLADVDWKLTGFPVERQAACVILVAWGLNPKGFAMRLKLVFSVILPMLVAASLPVHAAEKREALYDVVGDFNKDGVKDRAVIVLKGPGRKSLSDLTKDRYWLNMEGNDAGENADLAIYLGAGDGPVDVTKAPDFLLPSIADFDNGFDFITPPVVNDAGSLVLTTVYRWGSSYEQDKALTIVVRKGEALVVGYDHMISSQQGSFTCSVNYLAGKAEISEELNEGDGKPPKHLKTKDKPVPLFKWSAATQPKVCDGL